MDITNEQRDQAYATATEQQIYLYSSSESGRRLREIANKHNITSAEQYKNYALVVGDVILKLRNRAELSTLLSETLGIDTENALKITADLTDFFAQTKIPSPDDLSSDIEEAEAALNSIPQIRTMAEDMTQSQANKEEVVHSTTQSAILNNKQPAPAEDKEPKWGSAN